MNKSSEISGFYKLSVSERLKIVKEFANLKDEEVSKLKRTGGLDIEMADNMSENVIGTMELPLGVAVNFKINEKDYLIPMSIEEPSVVAAASNAAKIARDKGGFKAESTKPLMIGQVQVTKLKDIEKAKQSIADNKDDILKLANEQSNLIRLGGGAKDIELRVIDTHRGPMLIIHLIIDTKDAMGANVVNTMSESIAPMIERITGGKVFLRIVSNLSVHRISRSRAVFSSESLGGEEIVDATLEAYAFAESDPYRCATHNKGIMNGIIALALATGNDTRALESGAHAYAAINGEYKPLTKWKKNGDGDLVGEIEIPIAAGIIGGATKANPIAEISLKILNVESSRELGEVMSSLGLAQNLAALRALAGEGIQRGHMRLHAWNVATTAGAKGKLLDKVVNKMIGDGKISVDTAKKILDELKGE